MDSVYEHHGSGMKEEQAVDVEGVAGPDWCQRRSMLLLVKDTGNDGQVVSTDKGKVTHDNSSQLHRFSFHHPRRRSDRTSHEPDCRVGGKIEVVDCRGIATPTIAWVKWTRCCGWLFDCWCTVVTRLSVETPCKAEYGRRVDDVELHANDRFIPIN